MLLFTPARKMRRTISLMKGKQTVYWIGSANRTIMRIRTGMSGSGVWRVAEVGTLSGPDGPGIVRMARKENRQASCLFRYRSQFLVRVFRASIEKRSSSDRSKVYWSKLCPVVNFQSRSAKGSKQSQPRCRELESRCCCRRKKVYT